MFSWGLYGHGLNCPKRILAIATWLLYYIWWVISLKNNINFPTVKFIVNSLIDLLRYGGWQILFFIVFIKYKEDIRNVIIFVSKHISRFSIDKVSFEFENDVNEIQKKVGKGSRIVSTDDYQSDRDFDKLVSVRPDYAILDSWKDVELELEKIFPGQIRSSLYYIQKLGMNDQLDEKDLGILNELRRLRNKVVHEEKIFISQETAKKYRSQCLYIIKRLEDIKDKSA